MNYGVMARRSASAVVPVAMLLVPKCPLCLLPLFAALGSALPPAPALDELAVGGTFLEAVLVLDEKEGTIHAG